jgi:putrescine transport system permease protein
LLCQGDIDVTRRAARLAVLVPPYAWMLLFFALPIVVVFAISMSDAVVGIPPFSSLMAWSPPRFLGDVENYAHLLSDSYYLDGFVGSLRIAAVSTVLCLLIGYPMALAIARVRPSRRLALLLLLMLPFWTSFLIRTYAWMTLLNSNGIVNNGLLALGLIETPIPMLYTDFSVYLGIFYAYLPFMVLPIYAVIERHDLSLLEAAADLGAKPLRSFLQVTLPLSIPGIAAGSLLVFVPALGEFVVPELLGGSDFLMIGRLLWTETFQNRDWPLAAAVSIALLFLVVATVLSVQWVVDLRERPQ